MIPNVIHFVYGLKPQTITFSFMSFMAVWSAKVIHKPEKIKFHYHYEPIGYWWELTKQIQGLELVYTNLVHKIGDKNILKYQHMSDVIRLEILNKEGGIYLDTDTISVKSYDYLLDKKTVMAKEYDFGLCNAVMMSEKCAPFLKIWRYHYEKMFNPVGWIESSVILPRYIADYWTEIITSLDQSYFFYPGHKEQHIIWDDSNENISDNLTILHLWNTISSNLCDSLSPEWLIHSPNTLYGKLLINVLEKADISQQNWFNEIFSKIVSDASIKTSKYITDIWVRKNISKSIFNKKDIISYFNENFCDVNIIDLGCGFSHAFNHDYFDDINPYNWIFDCEQKNIKSYLGVDCLLQVYERNKQLNNQEKFKFSMDNIFNIKIDNTQNNQYDLCILTNVLENTDIEEQKRILYHIKNNIKVKNIIISKCKNNSELCFYNMKLKEELESFYVFCNN